MGEVVEFQRPDGGQGGADKPANPWEALEQVAVAIDGRPNDPLFVRHALRAVLQIFPADMADPRGRSVGLLALAILRALADVSPEGPRSA
jgi:hypothetical protein